jgi:hypothetical protein
MANFKQNQNRCRTVGFRSRVELGTSTRHWELVTKTNSSGAPRLATKKIRRLNQDPIYAAKEKQKRRWGTEYESRTEHQK